MPPSTLLRNGAGRLQAFFYGLLPQNAAELTSYTVYRWECAIRSSVVLGFVGAGGLGQQMDNSMKMFNGGEVQHHAAGVRGAGGAGRPRQRLAAQGPGHEPAPDDAAAAANAPYRLPPPLFDARCKACWFMRGRASPLVVASFWSLDLQWAQFLSLDALRSMGRFLAEFFPPDTSTRVPAQGAAGAPGRRWPCRRWAPLLAALAGLLLALPASRLHAATRRLGARADAAAAQRAAHRARAGVGRRCC